MHGQLSLVGPEAFAQQPSPNQMVMENPRVFEPGQLDRPEEFITS